MTEQTTFRQLKESHSPSMSDSDFLKMIAAANDISLTQNEDGQLNVATEEEKESGGPGLITPEQTKQTYLGSYATQHLTESGNIRGIASDAGDVAAAVIKSPLTLYDKAASAVEDVANAGLKWFDDDAEEIRLPKSGVDLPKTTAGRLVGTAAEIAIATLLTTPAGGAALATSIATHGAAKATAAATSGAMLKAAPQTATALQTTANALKNAAIDFITANPDDTNLAAELQGVIEKPWLAALATQPEDSRIVRRYKHMAEGFAIGELVFPAIGKIAGYGGEVISKLAKNGTKEGAAAVPAEVGTATAQAAAHSGAAVSNTAKPEGIISAPLEVMKSQLIETGLEPQSAGRMVNLLEAWGATAKREDESLNDFFTARRIVFRKADSPRPGKAKGYIDLPPIGTPFTKDSPATVTITLTDNADASTPLHELGHLFLHDRLDKEAKGLLSPEESKELESIKKLLGWKDGQKYVKASQQEKFAKSFEQWFQTGTAPKGSENTFKAFQSQMQDICEDAFATGATLPEEYNAFFGRMLGNADTDAETLRLFQLGANPQKEAEAIASFTRSKGQAAYGYTINPARLTGRDRQLHMSRVTAALNKVLPVPDDITRVHHVNELDKQARQMIYDATGSGEKGREMRQRIIEMMNDSKTWHAQIRYCEYMIDQGAEQLALLYNLLESADDEAAEIVLKGRLFSQLQNQALYRNANAQLTATAGRILEGKQHKLQALDFEAVMKEKGDHIFDKATPLFKEIPSEALESGDVEAIRKALEDIGMDKVDTFIQYGKLHLDDLRNASIAFDYQKWDLKRKTWETMKERFMSNVLSNPATWIVNIISNTAQAFVSPFAYIAQGAAKYGVGKSASFLGIEDFAKRMGLSAEDGANDFRLGMNLYHSYRLFVSDAFSIASRAFKSGRPIVGSSAAFVEDYSPTRMLSSEVWGLNPATNTGHIVDTLGQWLNIPSRVLMATDQFYKVLAGRGGTYAEIMEDAAARGLSDYALADFVEKEMSSRIMRKIDNSGNIASEIYASEAVRDFVKEQTFTQDAGAVTQAMIKAREAYPYVLYPLIPFIQSPVNIVKTALDYTPQFSGLKLLGASVTNLDSLLRKHQDIVKKGGLGRSKLLGQFAIAQGIWAAACYLVQEGRITGGLSGNPDVRKTQTALGVQPYSVKIGDTWYSYAAFDPIGTVFGIAADYHTITQQGDDSEEQAQTTLELARAMVAALGNNLGNKTYLMTLGNTLNALLNDPENSGKYWGNMAANAATGFFIPRVVTNAARDVGITDPYMKEIRGCLDKIKANIPGLSNSLPTQYSWLTGKPREYSPYSSINRCYTTSVKSDVPDRLRAELLQLEHILSGPSDKVNGHRLNGEQYSKYCRLNATITLGDKTLLEALDDAVHSERYDSADSDEKAKMLKRIIGHYRNAAKLELIEEYPELQKQGQSQTTAAQGARRSELNKLVSYGQK